MYTKIVLDESAVQEMVSSSTGAMFVPLLRDNAVLLLTPAQRKVLSTALPLGIWKRLEHDIETRRVLARKWSGQVANPGVKVLGVEVVVGDGPQSKGWQGTITDLPGYAYCDPVARRDELKSGMRTVVDREEFWTDCLAPVIDAFPENGRTLDIYDQYLFQDFRRTLREVTKSGSDPSRSLSRERPGLAWLLRRVDDFAAGLSLPPTVRLCTAEKVKYKDPDTLDKDQIFELLEQLVTMVSCENINLRVLIVPAQKVKPSTVGLKKRRLVVNGCKSFELAKGVGDFTDGKATAHSKAATTWTWSGSLNQEELAALKTVRDLVPDGFQFHLE